jgi:hypothetical protein
VGAPLTKDTLIRGITYKTGRIEPVKGRIDGNSSQAEEISTIEFIKTLLKGTGVGTIGPVAQR